MVSVFLRLLLFGCVLGLYAQEQEVSSEALPENMEVILCCPIEGKPEQFKVYGGAEGDVLVKELLDGEQTILQPDHVQFEYDEVIENPLKGKNIAYLDCFNKKPLMVTRQEPATLYVMEHVVSSTQQVLLKSEPLCDAHGNEGEIVAIGGYGSTASGLIIAAIKPKGGSFGQDGSGIAIIKCSHKILVEDESQGEEKIDTWIDVADFKTDPNDPNRLKVRRKKSYVQVLDASTLQPGNKAYPLDTTCSVLNINEGCKELGEHLYITFDDYGKCFYIGLDVQTGKDAGEAQGACALLMGRVTPGGFLIKPVFLDDNYSELLMASGPESRASIFNIVSYESSTKAHYLVVNGGQGQPEHTKKCVYAFPMAGQVRYQGALLPSKHVLVNSINKPDTNKATLTLRTFFYNENQAKNDSGCMVGSGPLPGPATTIRSVNDSIFATVDFDENSLEPAGLFYSQPIFDGAGVVCAWTPWQRMAGIQGAIGRMLNFSPLILSVASQVSYGETTIKRAAWNKKHPDETNSNQLVHVINGLFNKKRDVAELIKSQSSITHFTSFGPYDYCSNGGIATSFLLVGGYLADGYNKLVLCETGFKQHDHFALYPNCYETIIHHSKGSIQSLAIPEETTPILFDISGDSIQEIGAVNDSTIVSDGVQSWLVVSGPKGIAVLADENGCGWPTHEGVGLHFENLQEKVFQKLGSFKFVQRVFSDEGNLYVLTDKKLVRIALRPEALMQQKCEEVELACANKILGSFYECGISGPLCLLGTSKGLFCNGVGSDARGNEMLEWIPIKLSEQDGIAYNFSYKTPTGRDNDFGLGGQVYVQYGSRYNDYSLVYRLFIEDVKHQGIQPHSVARLVDTIINNRVMPYCSFYNFRSQFMPYGCFDFSCFSGAPNTPGYVQVFQIDKNIGKVLRPSKGTILPLKTKKIRAINACLQDKATGNWFIAGDFGMRVFGS